VSSSTATPADAPPFARPGPRVLRRLRRQPVTLAALILLTTLLIAGAFAPLLAPYTAGRIDLTGQWLSHPPTLIGSHLFGTDEIGRDILSRTLYGLRTTEAVALAVAAAATVIGLLVGGIAGYYGGWADAVLMRVVDVVTAYPALVLVLAAIVYTSPITPRTIGFVLTGYLWTVVARIVRASFAALRVAEYAEAAHALGASDVRIMLRHLLPNSTGAIAVAATSLVGQAVLLDATVEFFNYGLNENAAPTLGNLIADVTKYGIGFNQTVSVQISSGAQAWWTWVFPGIILVLLLVSVNLAGDGLDAALNPTGLTSRAEHAVSPLAAPVPRPGWSSRLGAGFATPACRDPLERCLW
jgi:peptide/nickel transport system permease protein